jgi:hypothetical protein
MVIWTDTNGNKVCSFHSRPLFSDTECKRMDGETGHHHYSLSLSTLCKQHRNDCIRVNVRFRNMDTVSTRKDESRITNSKEPSPS